MEYYLEIACFATAILVAIGMFGGFILGIIDIIKEKRSKNEH